MGPSPTYHPPEGEECETSVEHGLPPWAAPVVGYCSRRPCPSPMSGSRFVGARAVGLWVGEQKLLGKTPLRGNPSPEMTYLPSYLSSAPVHGAVGSKGYSSPLCAALHSGIAGSFCLSAIPLHAVGSSPGDPGVSGAPPPPRPPRLGRSVRMVDAMVGWED